jgi:hypothetical protein
MTEVPEPVPLDPPPGDVGALEDVVEDVAGAAYWLTVLSGDLSGPAASAPGWLGDDAAAAAAQVGTVAGIARTCSVAVGAAAHRLRLHHDLLREVRRQVGALRAEQDEDFRVAWRRLNALEDPHSAVLTDAPERVAVIEQLRLSEADRRRRHAALLEDIAEDAATTAAVLVDSSAVVGGQGLRGDGERVLAHLAAELPGWGERELAARGQALADELREAWPASAQDQLARRAMTLAGSPAFAEALVVALGHDGVSTALHDLGDGVLTRDGAMAQLLATAFGAAGSAAVPGDAVGPVLTARYLEDAAPGRERDLVMYGMAAVLRASAGNGSGGLQSGTVVAWARQIVAHERALVDVPTGREHPSTVAPADTLLAVVGALADLASPAAAAAVLREPLAWSLLLGRSWADGGAVLTDVALLAGADDGPDGERATRLGLEALGAGLADGDPDGWTVDRGTAAAVSPALAAAAAQHVTVLTGVLGLGLDGDLRGRAGDVLRGLGYLTLDDGAARTVGTALSAWVRTQPVPADLVCDPIPPPVVVVAGAFLAVREYGQRLAHALHGFEARAEAQHDERIWNATVGLLSEIPKSTVQGTVLGIVAGYAAMATGNDGWWDSGPDEGLRFDGNDAAAALLRLAPAEHEDVRGALAEHEDVRGALAGSSRVVFDRTGEALGAPRPPVPEERDLLGPLKDAATDAVENAGANSLERRRRRELGQDPGAVSTPSG